MKTIKSLYYHNPKPEGFEKMICYYKRKGYRFIALDELYSILVAKKAITEKLAFISLDDGWQGNLQLIPVIEKHNVPICIFVATEPLESGNYWWEYVRTEMSYQQMLKFKKLTFEEFYKQLNEIKQRNSIDRSAMTVEELKSICEHPLVTVQSHTVNHPILTNSPEDVLDFELSESKRMIEDITGKEVFAFSYPNGSLTEREVEACKKYYKIAFTTEQKHISIDDDIFLLPRYSLMGNYKKDLIKVYGVWNIVRFIKKKLRLI